MVVNWPVVLQEHKERLEEAKANVSKLMQEHTDGYEHWRLHGKVEGINLALGYLREMIYEYDTKGIK